jgi:hypothetical protein
MSIDRDFNELRGRMDMSDFVTREEMQAQIGTLVANIKTGLIAGKRAGGGGPDGKALVAMLDAYLGGTGWKTGTGFTDAEYGVFAINASAPADTITVGSDGKVTLSDDLEVNGGATLKENSTAIKDFEVVGDLIVATKTPSSAADTGTKGTIAWDATNLYVCVDTDTWVKCTIATW